MLVEGMRLVSPVEGLELAELLENDKTSSGSSKMTRLLVL